MSPVSRASIISAVALIATSVAAISAVVGPARAHAAHVNLDSPNEAGRTWLEQARGARKAQDLARALDLYRRAAMLPGTEEPGTVGVAQVQQIMGDNELALATLKDYLIRLDPFGLDIHLALVDLYLNAGQDAAAEKELAIVTRLRPGYAPANERTGVVAFRKGNFRLAVAALTKLLERAPAHARALELRARCYLAIGKYSSALADYKTLQSVEPDNIDTYLSIGRIYVQLGEYQAAEPYIQAALSASEVSPPQRVKILLLAGNFEQLRGDEKRAITYYRKAYDGDATDLKLGLKLSEMYFETHDFGQAQATFEKIIESAPQDQAAIQVGLKLADLYVGTHQFREAQGTLARIIQTGQSGQSSPGYESAARRMMELYDLLGQRDGLGAFLRNYLAAHPGQSWAAVAYAKLLLEVDDAPGAERVLTATLTDAGAPPSPEIAMVLVKIMNPQNRRKEALALLEKSVEKFPADDRLRFDLGLCYEKTLDPARAIAEYSKVSRKDAVIHQKASVNLAFIYEHAGDARKARETLSAAEPGLSGVLPPAILSKIEELGSAASRQPAASPASAPGDKK